MSVSRLCKVKAVSARVKRAFLCADPCQSAEEELWRAVAARAVLDAVGSPGISDPDDWNKAVREARLWFRYSNDGNTLQCVFDIAGVNLKVVRTEVLRVQVRYYDRVMTSKGPKYFKE